VARLREAADGGAPKDLARALTALAELSGADREAMQLYDRALQLLRSVTGDDDPDVAVVVVKRAARDLAGVEGVESCPWVHDWEDGERREEYRQLLERLPGLQAQLTAALAVLPLETADWALCLKLLGRGGARGGRRGGGGGGGVSATAGV
jgi:hypothetical protein